MFTQPGEAGGQVVFCFLCSGYKGIRSALSVVGPRRCLLSVFGPWFCTSAADFCSQFKPSASTQKFFLVTIARKREGVCYSISLLCSRSLIHSPRFDSASLAFGAQDAIVPLAHSLPALSYSPVQQVMSLSHTQPLATPTHHHHHHARRQRSSEGRQQREQQQRGRGGKSF